MNLLDSAFSVIDKAAKKGVIHKNNASRKKSRLHAKVKEYLGDDA
nr:30S ribosomal protein S20 [Marinitoga lauensis]